MTATDVKYRVIRLPDTLRTAIRATRDANKWTNAEFVGKTIEQQLPKLVVNLRSLGFRGAGGQTRPMRLPFADEYGSLDLLREASETVGLPATQLLALCFVAVTKGTPTASDAAHRDESPKATKRQAPRRQSEGEPKRTRARRTRAHGEQA